MKLELESSFLDSIQFILGNNYKLVFHLNLPWINLGTNEAVASAKVLLEAQVNQFENVIEDSMTVDP